MALPVILIAPTTTVAGAIAAGTGSAVSILGQPRAMAFVLDVTAAATDVGDTLDVKVQCRLDGTNWVDVCSFTQVLGNGGAKRHIGKINADIAQAMLADAALAAGSVRNLQGEVYRVAYAQVDADNNASFTFSVTACPM
jgi:hypothetical protein